MMESTQNNSEEQQEERQLQVEISCLNRAELYDEGVHMKSVVSHPYVSAQFDGLLILCNEFRQYSRE